MSGIAGIDRRGKAEDVRTMLSRIAHRGRAGMAVLEAAGATLGLAWTPPQSEAEKILREKGELVDAAGSDHFARATAGETGIRLERDRLGASPLYYGRTADGALAFASEVKALLGFAERVLELAPGSGLIDGTVRPFRPLLTAGVREGHPSEIAAALRALLESAVDRCLRGTEMGSWLSGGLDSSAIAALARPRLARLHTFAAGMDGAPDLEFAREAAAHIGSMHHEVRIDFAEMTAALPAVIDHLESFDALLVRSSVMNYLVARRAADFVSDVFSGEAGDELFAGYEYLKSIPEADLPGELADLIGRLHNTAFQRVDRCASAHGLVARLPFADPEVVDFALAVPAGLKIRGGVEKWILREALAGVLPDRLRLRPKSKFWEGAGVEDRLAAHAESRITDADFRRERILPNGWALGSKEELFYYRLFRERYGALQDLSWMGRTKGGPGSEE